MTQDCGVKADLNGVPVKDGDVVQLVVHPGQQTVSPNPGTGVITIKAPTFTMTVTCTDKAGNHPTTDKR